MKLILSPAPHIRDGVTIPKIMWSVVLCLIPSTLYSIYLFGLSALLLIVTSISSALLTEALILKMRRREVIISDGSAFLTGLLLGLNLPPDVPFWLPILGSVFAVALVKHAFGGLGHNIFNPALGGRVFLLLAYSDYMTTTWKAPRGGVLSIKAITQLPNFARVSVDAITGATPLKALQQANKFLADPEVSSQVKTIVSQHIDKLNSPDSLLALFLGNIGGCIGETSAILLLLGAMYLLWKRYISWHIPLTFIGSLALFTWIGWIPGATQPFSGNPLFHILSGGALLGAFFMATDMVTSPITPKGMIIFGIGCGIITGIIRLYGGYPEGVSFAILLMNAATPLIDRHTVPRKFGGRGA